MGHLEENASFGSWREGSSRLWGMSWGRSSPAAHAFLALTQARTATLGALALQATDEDAWAGQMATPEAGWFSAQPASAREGLWLAAKDWAS